MAGSIEDNVALYKKKAITYVPLSPQAELIELTSYTLDFRARKFVNIGIDPTEKFQVVVHVLTSSRHVKISSDFLRRIFSMMGHLLSFILDTPQKYKHVIFLDTEFNKISSMVYRGENVLAIESRTQDGCRVLLNRTDGFRLQYLERCIIETIVRKEVFTVPLILKQSEEFATYLEEKRARHNSPHQNLEDMKIFVKNVQDDRTDKFCPNYTSQIQMCAFELLAESVLNRSNSHEIFSPLSPSYSPINNISNMQDFSTTSDPFKRADVDILAKAFDHIDGPRTPQPTVM